MAKPKNPGYVAGDNWETCERCGQAFRSSDMRTQWDGLRVCPADYDHRHPQDMVRDTEFSCRSTKGGFADNAPGDRLLLPDIEPLAFVQEPNDAYFTSPPRANVGIGAIALEVSDVGQLQCSDLEPLPLFSWFSATDRLDLFDGATKSSLSPEPVVCDEGVTLVENMCANAGLGGITLNLTNIVDPPTINCSAYSTGNYGTIPAFAFDADIDTNYSASVIIGDAWGFYNNEDQPRTDIDWTHYIVMSVEDVSNGSETIMTTVRTSSEDTSSEFPDEGYRIYSAFGKTYFGLRIPKESFFHPLNTDKCPNIAGGFTNPEATDLNFYFFEVPLNEPFLIEMKYTVSMAYYKLWTKTGVPQTYTLSGLNEDCRGDNARLLNGGYAPMHTIYLNYNTGVGWNMYESMTLSYPEDLKVQENERQTVREYLSWKYEIPIDTPNNL